MKLSPIPLFILRVALGAMFLYTGIEKYHEGWFSSPDQLVSSLNSFHGRASTYQLQYLDAIAIPYASLWTKLICGGEFLLGVSLLFGCLARFSALVGMLFVLNIYAANGSLFGLRFFGTPWSVLIFASLLVLFLVRAGRWGGLDALFAKSNAKSFFW